MHREDAEGIVFIDFEASGLGSGSWPIEIGLSWIEGDGIKTWSSLIRPEPGWVREAWDPVSENIHGISLVELESAPSARSVAEAAAQLIAGKTVCSDAPEFDERWAKKLFLEFPQVVPLRIVDIYSVYNYVLTGAGLDQAYEKLLRSIAPHRAGPDAERYARALLHALRY